MEASTGHVRRACRARRATQTSLAALAAATAAMVTIGLAGEITRPDTTLPEAPPIAEPAIPQGTGLTVEEVVTIRTSWADRTRMGRIIHHETVGNGSEHRHGRLDDHGTAIYQVTDAELARLRALAGADGDGEAREANAEPATVRIRLQSPLVDRTAVRNALWAAGAGLALAMTATIITLSWLTEIEQETAGRSEQ